MTFFDPEAYARELLSEANEAQRAAIEHVYGPELIIAGAGTGKTNVITKKIAWLLVKEFAKPEEILALTFTEKAAREMEERVDRLLPLGYVDVTIATFHAFCERILARHGIDMGLAGNTRVITEIEAWLLLRKHLSELPLVYFKPRGNPTKFLRDILKHISRCKDEGITAQEYRNHVEGLYQASGVRAGIFPEGMPEEERLDLAKWKELADVYVAYEQLLADEDLVDFGGLLLGVYELFTHRPNILAKYQAQYRFIIVDEFQDTNTVQYRIVSMLAKKERNITVVGDDDQAIYRFRGAALSNMLMFREEFPEAKRSVLTENYRSGGEILRHAYDLIQHNNPDRLEVSEGISKELRAKEGANGGFVVHYHLPTLADEVMAVFGEMISRVSSGEATWGDFAILARSNDALTPFLEESTRYGIPCTYATSSGLYTKPLILDILSYARIVTDEANSPAWYRVLTHPHLGLSTLDTQAILAHVRKKGCSLVQALRGIQEGYGVSFEGRKRVIELLDLQGKLLDRARRSSAVDMFVVLVKETGLLGDIKLLPEQQQKEEFSLLEEFLGRIQSFAERASGDDVSLRAFLEEFDAEREAGESGSLPKDREIGPDVVQLMTVHAAKGLEFRYVFVVNTVEQRFPSVGRSDGLDFPPGLFASSPEQTSAQHLSEERRLFYVAITRAREGLFLCSADSYGGVKTRKPSRFLQEMGVEAQRPTSHGHESRATVPSSVFLQEEQKPLRDGELSCEVPDEVSFSQLAAFTTCPLQYKYAHLIKIPTFGRHQLSFGQTMHHTFQHFLERVQDAQAAAQTSLFSEPVALPTLQDILTLYDEHFIDAWYPSSEVKEEYRAKGRDAARVFYEQVTEQACRPWRLECGFHLPLAQGVLKGRIDRIDLVEGGVEIIDYKTGSPKKKLEWDDRRQLLIYALAAERCFSPALHVVKLTYYYVEDGSTVSFVPTDKEKEKLLDFLDTTIDLLHKKDFSPTPSEHVCKYCDFKEICPFSAV